jgi:hypothetical protein
MCGCEWWVGLITFILILPGLLFLASFLVFVFGKFCCKKKHKQYKGQRRLFGKNWLPVWFLPDKVQKWVLAEDE